MDRLTIPDVKVDSHTTRRTMIDAEAVKERAMEIYWKLKKYEDTGLMPAEVLSMSGEWCAMMSVLNRIGSYDRLRELSEADKEGRVVVLPCKVGDRIYRIQEYFNDATLKHEERIKACTVGRVSIDSLATDDMVCLPFDRIGKTVFYTREEAEKALEAK